MARMKGNIANIMLLVIAVMVVGLGILGQCAGEKHSISPEEVAANRTRSLERAADAEKDVADLLAAGSVHSIELENCIVRIDPLLWAPAPIEVKRRLLVTFKIYFESRGESSFSIRSDRNDILLASYDPFYGAKIPI